MFLGEEEKKKKTRPFYEHCGIDWVKVDDYFLEKHPIHFTTSGEMDWMLPKPASHV